MNETTGAAYVPPWTVGEGIVGFAGVGTVLASRHPAYCSGDLLYGSPAFPWRQYFIEDMDKAADNYRHLDKTVFGTRPALALSLLGLSGLTAYIGLLEMGHILIGTSQTCVVSGAAGSCGAVAGQVARLIGCSNVVGICGTDRKCDWLTGSLGFNAAINYRTQDAWSRLRTACPDGVHVYFDNVGGPISDAVIQQMRDNTHIVLCGQISLYNENAPHVLPVPANTAQFVKQHNITRNEYLVLDYADKFPEALKQLKLWHDDGQIQVREMVTEGLENVGKAFCDMMAGKNMGKQVVHVADP